MTALVLAAGILAGVVTTVSGMGGGLLLLLVLAVVVNDPVQALVLSSPGLLVGNVHRAYRLRDHTDWTVAWPVVVGAVPASFAVAMWVVNAPVDWIRWAMLVVALLAAARGLGWMTWTPSPRWAFPVGMAAGAVQSTAGGAGVVMAPYLMGRELSGRSYVGTMAAVAVFLHVSRLAAFGAGGLVTTDVLSLGAGIAVAIVVGNRLGDVIAGHLNRVAQRRSQVAVLLGAAGLAVAGFR